MQLLIYFCHFTDMHEWKYKVRTAPQCPWHPKLWQKRQDGSSVIMRVSEIWTCIRKNRAQLFDDHSEIEQESFWPAKVKSLWDLEVLKNRHPTRIQFVASRRRGRTAAGGNGRKNRRCMTFEPILVGYVGTCLLERHVQLKRRRRPSAHFCSYWSRMQTLAWSDVLSI